MVKETAIQVPIFPLPTSILFPGIYVPFHIFEERYKAMVKFVGENQSLMAVSYAPELQPGKSYPSMVCGAGPVRIIKNYENGESDILIYGTERIKFQRYIQEVPFLIGEGVVLQMNREMPEKTEKDLLGQIKEMLINWIFASFEDSSRPIQFFKTVTDLEPLCNFVSYYLISDVEKKQKLLEENELQNKAQAVWQILKDVEATGGSPRDPKSSPLIFPGSGSSKKDYN